MKTFFSRFLLFLVLLSSLSVAAQTHYESRVFLGAKAGAAMSRVFFNPTVKQGMQPGAVVGISVKYVEESHFGLLAELNFVQRGWKENFEEAPYNYSRTINYLELPVMTHIFFGRRGKFFFNAGPQIGLCLGESTKANFDPYDTASLPDFPNTNRRNSQMTIPVQVKFDYGICAGLGGEFSVNPKNSIGIEARAYYGLGNIFHSKRKDIFSSSNFLSFSLCAFYTFRVK